MANRERGEVSITIGKRAFTLVLDTNAMCEAEALFSTPEKPATFQQIHARMVAGSVIHMRGVLWAALRRYHPNISVEDVGTLTDLAGGLPAFAFELSRLATEAAVPDPEDLEAIGASRNPPKAQASRRAGIGPRSIVRRAGLA